MYNYFIFVFLDAANVFSSNIEVSHEDFQVTEVKTEPDENSPGETNDVFTCYTTLFGENNSTEDNGSKN